MDVIGLGTQKKQNQEHGDEPEPTTCQKREKHETSNLSIDPHGDINSQI